MLQFVSPDKKVAELGMRLKEELIHELKALIIKDSSVKTTPDVGQMDLFEKPQSVFEAVSPKDMEVKKEPMTVFFDKLMEVYSVFDDLNEVEKDIPPFVIFPNFSLFRLISY